MTADIEKTFDSLSHSFLLSCLKKFGFGHDFIRLLERQKSYIIKAGTTTSYFNLEKCARQGDPVSAYLFILCLEVLFLLVKANHKIRGVNVFQYTYLYTAYSDDTTYFLKNKNSIRQIMETFHTFSQCSCLKNNYKKCENAGIGALKSVKVAVCGMKCVDLCKDTIRLTGIHFSYNKTKQDETNFFETISKIQNALKIWRMRSLTLEGKIMMIKVNDEFNK